MPKTGLCGVAEYTDPDWSDQMVNLRDVDARLVRVADGATWIARTANNGYWYAPVPPGEYLVTIKDHRGELLADPSTQTVHAPSRTMVTVSMRPPSH